MVTARTVFEFATAGRILFGDGVIQGVGQLVGGTGKRVFLVTGASALRGSGSLDRISETLKRDGHDILQHSIVGEPTVGSVDSATDAARAWKPDVLLAVGGGSVIDAAKAVAGLVTNTGSVLDYLEGVGVGRRLEHDPVLFIAAPTTAGTGSEVTKNAVITGDDGGFKKSFRDPRLIPDFAVVDTELTHSMPPSVTATSGLDALTQLIESYTSNGASPMTDALALQGIHRAATSLERAYADGSDSDARSDMALASLLGGITLANAGLGAVHGFASPLGANYPAPHGAVCAILLPLVVRANAQFGVEETQRRYTTIAETMLGEGADTSALVSHLESLVERLGIPGLSTWGLEEDGIADVVAGARGASMRYNPVELDDATLTDILHRAF
jgi:alcohol dehydrogenase class IV